MTVGPVPEDPLTVVIPAYNEEKNLPELLASLETELTRARIPFLVIVVDNCSTDGTPGLLDQIAAQKSWLTVIHQRQHRGVGNALRLGLSRARTTFVATLDGDNTHHPKYLPPMVSLLARYDLVVGTRYRGWVNTSDDLLVKKLVSTGYNLAVQLFLGVPIPDVTSGYRVFRARVLPVRDLQSQHFGIYIETILSAYGGGARLGAHPIYYPLRRHGESSFRLVSSGVWYFRYLLKYMGLRLRGLVRRG
jgi:dolichol-phosphate mannosyltransferase